MDFSGSEVNIGPVAVGKDRARQIALYLGASAVIACCVHNGLARIEHPYRYMLLGGLSYPVRFLIGLLFSVLVSILGLSIFTEIAEKEEEQDWGRILLAMLASFGTYYLLSVTLPTFSYVFLQASLGAFHALLIASFPKMARSVTGGMSHKASQYTCICLALLCIPATYYVRSLPSEVYREHVAIFGHFLSKTQLIMGFGVIASLVALPVTGFLGLRGNEDYDEEGVFNPFTVTILTLILIPSLINRRTVECLTHDFVMLFCLLIKHYGRRSAVDVKKNRALLKKTLIMTSAVALPYVWEMASMLYARVYRAA
jgi:hypothetical protein